MALIERLMGLEEPGISVHALGAAMGEKKRGRLSNAQIQAMFALDNAGRSELAALRDRVNSDLLTAEEVEHVLTLAEQRARLAAAPYTTAADVRVRLGL